MAEEINLKILLMLTVGFGLASLLGYISYRAKLSPILGYLLAGYMIGPYSRGYVADMELSEQLAEIGVVLMMFGVGLQFKAQELLDTFKIALPGAIFQTLCTTLAGTALTYYLGWSWQAGIIFGLALGVASTVVLVRILHDNHLLKSPQGHIAVGWLVVEDIITVAALLLLPLLEASMTGNAISIASISSSFILILFKFSVLILVMFTVGQKVVSYIFHKVMQTQSHELFTLTILAITFIIATGSLLLFHTSIALGAFIAGMVVGRTEAHQEVSKNALPLKDAFVVIFFLSIGMLFDPTVFFKHLNLFLWVMAIILLLKPITAFLIVIVMRYPFKTALTIAIALAQIGEFSFILAEQANKLKILPDEGYDVIVAGSLFSIAINPLIFKWLNTEKDIKD